MKNDPDSLRSAIASLFSKGPEKFKTAKVLMALSETNPEVLYPIFDSVAGLLETDNKIIRWSAIAMIANLASVDREGRIDRLIDLYLAPIPGPVMITAGNTMRGATTIAASHKHLADKIVQAMLQVEHGHYQTEECRNIAIGHAIKALSSLAPELQRSERVIDFVTRQTQNSRASTRKMAEQYLKKYLP
jgi:hypothetical protein